MKSSQQLLDVWTAFLEPVGEVTLKCHWLSGKDASVSGRHDCGVMTPQKVSRPKQPVLRFPHKPDYLYLAGNRVGTSWLPLQLGKSCQWRVH